MDYNGEDNELINKPSHGVGSWMNLCDSENINGLV